MVRGSEPEGEAGDKNDREEDKAVSRLPEGGHAITDSRYHTM